MDPSKPIGFRIVKTRFLLPAILFLALTLRCWGVWFGLPYLYHADEPIVVNHALAYGTGDLNPHFFNIPPLVSYLLFFCYGIYYLAGRLTGAFHAPQDFENLFYFDPSSFYLIARLVFGVFLGTLTVLVLYRLVKRFWNRGVALLAAFFLAANFLHARDSHYIYVDIPLLFVFLAGLFPIFRISERLGPDKKSALRQHLFAGVMVGLAAAAKYNGIFLAIPYLWICFRTVPWRKWFLACPLAGAAAFVTFAVLNPFSVLDHGFFMKEIVEQSAANAGGLPWSHHLTYSLAGAMGWPMLGAGILGALRALIRKEPKMQALAVFVAGYYLVLCRFGQPYDRYVLPLIPVFCVLAADFLILLKGQISPQSRAGKIVFAVVISGLVLPSVAKIIQWDRIMAAKDMRTVTKEWVETNIPAGSRIVMGEGFFMPRLEFSADQLKEKIKSLNEGSAQSAAKTRRLNALLSRSHQPFYELYFLSQSPTGPQFLFGGPRIAFDLGAIRRQKVDYVILAEQPHDPEGSFRSLLAKDAERVAVFSPFRDGKSRGNFDGQILTGGPFLWKDIAARERNGYPISVYRMRS